MAGLDDLRFQAGGALRSESFYIKRGSDSELFDALARRELCYVLAPRQIGKSSLRVRVANSLQAAGIRCGIVDLNDLQTTEITPDIWYRGLARTIASTFGLAKGFVPFWEAVAAPPIERLGAFFREYLPSGVEAPMIVFLDEVDTVRQLPFPVDDFFAMIRALYDARATTEGLRRLSFCILGVALPGDLIADPLRTPFNIGYDVGLQDFTREEIAPLARGLHAAGGDPDRLLDEVFWWTSGHPYMTQKLCERLAKPILEGPQSEAERVETLTREVFLARGQESNPNLDNAAKRLDSRPRGPEMLELYKRVRSGERVLASSANAVQEELRMTGMIMEHRDGDSVYLRVRNRIFEQVFDEAWIWERERRRPLADRIRIWSDAGKAPEYLLKRIQLRETLDWANGRTDLTATENEFLRSAVAAEWKQRQRTIIRVAGIALAAVALASTSVISFVRMRAAQEEAAALREVATLQGSLDQKKAALREVEEKKSALEKQDAALRSEVERLEVIKLADEKALIHLNEAKEKALKEMKDAVVQKNEFLKQRDVVLSELLDIQNAHKQDREVLNQHREELKKFEAVLGRLRDIKALQDALDAAKRQLAQCPGRSSPNAPDGGNGP